MTALIMLFIFPSVSGQDYTRVQESDNIRKTIPYTLPWDDMPVDLSFLYESEKPAGKHGFLNVEKDRFIFEDGTTARFWGTNFNSAQIFPPHDHSEKVAKRLAKTGVNIVRFHQMDAEWSTPNIFQLTKGQNIADTQSFDPESMDRLDYLIYCLKREGIYVYMDLLTYRRFKTGDGVAEADKLRDAAKPYTTFNRRLIELQKKFNYDLWTHFNPYTKLAYKDDPAIVLVEITNENDLWSQEATLEPYRSELEELYRKWAADKKIKLPEGKITFDKKDLNVQNFFIDATIDYYREMTAHMRETGVKIPVAGTNWTRNVAHLSAQMNCDFIDTHTYTSGNGGWRNGEGKFGNEPNMYSTNNLLPAIAFYKVQDKPLFISEWDNPWPNEWRAESSIMLASVGSFQGWGGFAIHTYRYSQDEDVDMIGKPITSGSIAGVYYRGGVFDTFNDPAKYGLFYHAALIMRRGDVRPAEKKVSIKPESPFDTRGKAHLLTAEKHRIETVPQGVNATGDILAGTNDVIVNQEEGEVLSDTRELYRNLKKGIGWIDSPNTKAVYGFTGKEGEFSLTDLSIDVKTDFATVVVSTLTDEPVRSSSNMLLTAVGRAENTGSRYNEDRTRQLDPGHGPVQVEIIEASVKIKTDKTRLRVMSINPQGFITGYIPSEYKNGIFSFEIGKEFQSIYYLIQDL
ncbi:MAG: cellulase family glycosylhydrolase [Prolixibacteraceae bacterium]|nr:cellulase family glycosylhydrolase [Prolixibacteraceae bacterium]